MRVAFLDHVSTASSSEHVCGICDVHAAREGASANVLDGDVDLHRHGSAQQSGLRSWRMPRRLVVLLHQPSVVRKSTVVGTPLLTTAVQGQLVHVSVHVYGCTPARNISSHRRAQSSVLRGSGELLEEHPWAMRRAPFLRRAKRFETHFHWTHSYECVCAVEGEVDASESSSCGRLVVYS